MTTPAAGETKVCPKCKGLCTRVTDMDGDYNKCVNCGWTSDGQQAVAEEPASEEAAHCTGPECELGILNHIHNLCSAHYQQKRKGASLTPLIPRAKPMRARDMVSREEAPLPEPQVVEEEASPSTGLTVEGLLGRLYAHREELEDEWRDVNLAIVVIERAMKEANA